MVTLRVARFPQKWLSFEADLDGKKHFLHSGCWYAIESDYAEVALGRVREIFSRPNQIQMIPWAQEYDDELTYNQKLAKVNDGVYLDRALISIRSRKSRIEDCDALLERGVFVHVKRTDGSASASHLIAQAQVSAEILTYDEDAQNVLRDKIHTSGFDPDDCECRPE